MISKSLRRVANQAAKPSPALLVSTPVRFAGGGEKKPNMPAGVTDFDVLLVGKYPPKKDPGRLHIILWS